MAAQSRAYNKISNYLSLKEMEYQVGEFYDVPCADIMMDDGRVYPIPVFDHVHADHQFGFPYQHYHIDGRFHLHPRMQHEFSVRSGHTSAVLITEETKGYRFLEISIQNLKCERLTTGLDFPTDNLTERQEMKLELYKEWYQTYLGKKCAGRKCPHFGTEMLERDGVLVCPMHHLTADPATLEIIEHQIV
jgi:hypothetical protein